MLRGSSVGAESIISLETMGILCPVVYRVSNQLRIFDKYKVIEHVLISVCCGVTLNWRFRKPYSVGGANMAQ